MSQDKEASKNDGGGEEEEEHWIESDWLRDQQYAQKKEDDNQEDDPPDVTDLFADPDPMDTFRFTWTIDDIDEDHVDDDESSRNKSKKRTIDIRLDGYKAELGQTLSSTGLTLWRASQLLSDHLVAHARKVIYGKRVVELGAGMGLCGILASHLGASSVLLTDGDTDALAQLRRNVQATCESHASCRQLVWGRNLDNFVSEHGFFDVVLGSDIIYVEEIIDPLFETIERIMNPNPDDDATFILAYARRNVPIDLVLDHAKQRGFVWTCPEESAEGIFCFKRAWRREG